MIASPHVSVAQLGTLKEGAIHDQDGISCRHPWILRDGLVGVEVEGRGAVPPIPPRTERCEQEGDDGGQVASVVVVPLRRVATTSVALGARTMEAVDGRSDHGPPLSNQRGGEFVAQGGLAGRRPPIDRDAHRVAEAQAPDPPGDLVQYRRPAQAHLR